MKNDKKKKPFILVEVLPENPKEEELEKVSGGSMFPHEKDRIKCSKCGATYYSSMGECPNCGNMEDDG